MTAPASAAAQPGCGYLHNAFGPGCPFCTEATGGAAAHALAAEAALIHTGPAKAEPVADLTEDERDLANQHDKAVA